MQAIYELLYQIPQFLCWVKADVFVAEIITLQSNRKDAFWLATECVFSPRSPEVEFLPCAHCVFGLYHPSCGLVAVRAQREHVKCGLLSSPGFT